MSGFDFLGYCLGVAVRMLAWTETPLYTRTTPDLADALLAQLEKNNA